MDNALNGELQYENILVTGGAGFVGSNLAVFFKRKYPSLEVIVLDNLKRRGSELNIPRLKEEGVRFIHGDIRNKEDLENIPEIDLLIECSAEPSVLASYKESPAYLINTNLVGSINCFELASKNKSDIIFLSTSRVYPYDAINNIKVIEKETRFEWNDNQENIEGWSKNGINEKFTLNGPKSLYGATKLCSEIILQEYMKMYELRGVINRCSIIAGPWQFGKVDQGVFALWMLAHYFKKPLEYIGFEGKGKQVRDLLHIEDLLELINIQMLSMDKASGKIYNVGGGTFANLSLVETTMLCEAITNNRIQINSSSVNRPADVMVYISDNTKVLADFSWRPRRSTNQIMEDIYNWIKESERSISQIFFT